MRNAYALVRVPLGPPQGPEPEPDPESTLTPDQRGLAAIGRIIEWLEKHPWVIAAVPTLVVVKILRVAEGDLGTAQVILAAQGVAGLTSLVLLSVLPGALVVAFILAVMLAGDITEAKEWRSLWLPEAVNLVTTFTLSLWFMPPLMFVGALALGLCLAIGRFIYNRRQRKRREETERVETDEIGSHGWPEIFVVTTMGAIVGALVSAAALGAMWAPAEQVTLKEAPTLVVGYVLSDDGNRVVILLEADRSTASYRSDEIEARQRCELTERQIQQQYPEGSAGLVSLLYHPSSAYPDCPS